MIQFFKNRKKKKSNNKNHDKRFNFAYSMFCVVKKFSMNGCEMSSLFLGHFFN